MASTPVQIFTIDTTTGNVAINGNLFVRSANNNASWIVGDMIKANTLITLCNGNIVFNGSNGSVTVKDPDAPNSGTYTYINSGVLNQYYLGTLMRSLTNIESGQANNNANTDLTNSFEATPSVIVTPKNIQTYNSTYNKQNQTFNCNVTVTSLGNNKYRIKPTATISVASGTDNINAPAIYTFEDHRNEITTTQADVDMGDFINPGFTAANKVCTFTTDSVRTGPNCNKVVVNASTYGIAVKSESGLYNNGWYVTAASHKWRIKYKLHSASTWSYSSYSTETSDVGAGQTVTSSLTQSFSTAGDYDIAAEFVLKRTGSTTIGHSSSIYPGRVYPSSTHGDTYTSIDSASVKINSIQCTRPAKTVTPTGTLNYIAVGR